jgi:hypothetical protein
MSVEINYLAVALSAVSNIIIGFLWYGPLFGKAWADMMGFKFNTPEDQKMMQKKAIPGYIASFVGALIMAYTLAHYIAMGMSFFGTTALAAGFQSAFWGWLGLIVPVTVGIVFWESKPWKLWFINASYWLVSLLAMGAIQAFMM